MAQQGQTEYEQYAPQTNGRLFSNAMFGFNKEQVLEYLEEMSEENSQRQEMASLRIQELDRQVKQMESAASRTQQMLEEQKPPLTDAELQKKLEELANALQITREAGMLAEDELAAAKEKLFNMQSENDWLREEHQKTDKQLAELRRQLDEASHGQWLGAEEQIAELRRKVEEVAAEQRETQQERDALLEEIKLLEAEREVIEAERDAAEAERDAAEAERELLLVSGEEGQSTRTVDLQTTRQLVEEAEQEAEYVRKVAYAERERVHRQMLSSAGGLANNISNIREDITVVEGEVTHVLESVQTALAELLVSLNHTEQNLHTLDVQVERFPTPSPAVAKRESMTLQPVSAVQDRELMPRVVSRGEPAWSKEKPAVGSAQFHRVWPQQEAEKQKAQLFRPGFSNSTGVNFAQTARALPQQRAVSEEVRMRELTDTLVDTLRQMLV